jgi:carbonic anhydrase
MLNLDERGLRETIGSGASDVDFLPFADLEESVRASVRRVRESPLLPDSYAATGMIYDVESGRLRPVE